MRYVIDLLFMVGYAALVYGVAEHFSRPIAYMVGGAILMTVTAVAAKRVRND